MTSAEYRSDDELTEKTQYPKLADELWGVLYEYLREKCNSHKIKRVMYYSENRLLKMIFSRCQSAFHDPIHDIIHLKHVLFMYTVIHNLKTFHQEHIH